MKAKQTIPEQFAPQVKILAGYLVGVAVVTAAGAKGAPWGAYAAMRQGGVDHDAIMAGAVAAVVVPKGADPATVNGATGVGAARSTVANWKRGADAVLSNPARGVLVEKDGTVLPITQALAYASEDAKANGQKGAAAKKANGNGKGEADDLADADGVRFDDLKPAGKAAFVAATLRALVVTPDGLAALGEFVPDFSAVVTALAARSVADGEEFARAVSRGLIESKARARALAEAEATTGEAAIARLRGEAEALEKRATEAAKAEAEAREFLATAEAEKVGQRKLTAARRAVKLAETAAILSRAASQQAQAKLAA